MSDRQTIFSAVTLGTRTEVLLVIFTSIFGFSSVFYGTTRGYFSYILVSVVVMTTSLGCSLEGFFSIPILFIKAFEISI